jgi:peroxiredoxin
MGSKPDLIRKALKARGITYSVAPDIGNAMSKQYGVQAHPTTLLIDRAGKIVQVEIGYVRGDEKKMEAAFLPLLDRPKEQRP